MPFVTPTVTAWLAGATTSAMRAAEQGESRAPCACAQSSPGRGPSPIDRRRRFRILARIATVFASKDELPRRRRRCARSRSPSLLAEPLKARGKTAKGLAALGIETHGDLLEHLPHTHQDRRDARTIATVGRGGGGDGRGDRALGVGEADARPPPQARGGARVRRDRAGGGGVVQPAVGGHADGRGVAGAAARQDAQPQPVLGVGPRAGRPGGRAGAHGGAGAGAPGHLRDLAGHAAQARLGGLPAAAPRGGAAARAPAGGRGAGRPLGRAGRRALPRHRGGRGGRAAPARLRGAVPAPARGRRPAPGAGRPARGRAAAGGGRAGRRLRRRRCRSSSPATSARRSTRSTPTSRRRRRCSGC